MSDVIGLLAVAVSILATAIFLFGLRADYHSRRECHERELADGFSDDDSVEVDCRLCGQFNRVAVRRLRDRPRCGRCKTALMPGKRIVICRIKPLDKSLNADLDAAWNDEARLWDRLADHIARKNHAEQAPGPRVTLN